MEQLQRIEEMESAMCRVSAALEKIGPALDAYLEVQSEFRALTEYYESPLWREDFEADENGLLPRELRRGVLSEDGLYDLLRENDELREKLQKVIM